VSSIAHSFVRQSDWDALKSHILTNSNTFSPARCRAMTRSYTVLATAYSGIADEQKCREAVNCAEVFADAYEKGLFQSKSSSEPQEMLS